MVVPSADNSPAVIFDEFRENSLRNAEPQPGCWTVQQLDEALIRERSATAHALDAEWQTIRTEFAKLSHAWAPLLSEQRLQAPALSTLHKEAVQALAVTRRIYEEAERAQRGAAVAPPWLLSDPLLSTRAWLDRIAGQSAGFHATASLSAETKQFFDQLASGELQDAAGLRHLVRRIRQQVRPLRWIEDVVQRTDLMPAESRGETSPLDLLSGRGLRAARVIAWLGTQAGRSESQIDLLTAAALLADVGLLQLLRKHGGRPETLASQHPRAYSQHAALGSALVGGLENVSFDLQKLIAEHHEHLDGTGSPHRKQARELGEMSRTVAAVLRFLDLTRIVTPAVPWRAQRNFETAAGSCVHLQHLMRAACQLTEEVTDGWWDHTACRLLAGVIDERFADAVEVAVAEGSEPDYLALQPHRWRLDAGHDAPTSPHLLQRRRTAA